MENKTKSTEDDDNDKDNVRWRVSLITAAAGVLLVAVWFSVSYLVGPPVPRSLNIATGSSAGVYYAVGLRYREILSEHGIELNVIETDGSVENLELLQDRKATLAIVQGGVGGSDERQDLSSLASLYLEPVWVFYRNEFGSPDDLPDFTGGTIGIGLPGSGTHSIAIEWLAVNGFDVPDELSESATSDGTNYVQLTAEESAAALISGDVDAAFFVVGANSKIISQLVSEPTVSLLNVQRGDAYATRYRYLKQVTFAEGMLDLQQNLPAADVELMATTANLVASDELHPALIQLLLQAAQDVHEPGGFFEAPREFPSPFGVDIEINEDAQRYFRNGPSFLYRFLPFRWANWLDRMKLLLAPMIVLLVPLAKAFPPVYRFRIRRRIYTWYRVLREIDQKLKQQTGDVDFAEDIQHLQKMETELAEVSVPLSYMEEFYNLRLHVNYVLDLLRERCRDSDSPVETTAKTDGSDETV